MKEADFLVDGSGDSKNITHVELKNSVLLAYKKRLNQKNGITKQAKGIFQRLVFQKNLWTNRTMVKEKSNFVQNVIHINCVC